MENCEPTMLARKLWSVVGFSRRDHGGVIFMILRIEPVLSR